MLHQFNTSIDFTSTIASIEALVEEGYAKARIARATSNLLRDLASIILNPRGSSDISPPYIPTGIRKEVLHYANIALNSLDPAKLFGTALSRSYHPGFSYEVKELLSMYQPKQRSSLDTKSTPKLKQKDPSQLSGQPPKSSEKRLRLS